MGRSYTWELGFHFAMLPDPGNENRIFLLNGFVAGLDLASSMLIEAGDSVAFSLFNVTPGALPGGYQVRGGFLKFYNALVASDTAYPFIPAGPVTAGGDNPAMPPHTITPEILPPSLGVPATIAIPELGATTYSDLSTTFPGRPYPRWNLVNAQTFALDGIFTVTFQVIVKGPNGQEKLFRVDPQMIIGGAG